MIKNRPILQKGDNIIERKVCYDGTIVEHDCKLLKSFNQTVILFHKIAYSFSMKVNHTELTIPEGSYTIAYYWRDQPYNLYIWRNHTGDYLGSYFNIVRNTYYTHEFVSFEDLIIDVLVLPNGDYFILDEHELPVPLEQFENGFVQEALKSLCHSIDTLLPQKIVEAEKLFKHEQLVRFIK
ncbi:DUF402 domain-containing protein [Bacillus solimangrovi]|uniref:DUF402 domain-containing protein n=1 Tax=Bacillus solimangrovi TaxID=1305675 RepID=A0A1E5LG50_9BACI|nr:DUF402 domain-containing protein [Bacillus solimangrovi]OEH93057.1 hypothetical protein BFG57_13970 [Bacillus solimangrovi]